MTVRYYIPIARWTEDDARAQAYFEHQNNLALITEYAECILEHGEAVATEWLNATHPDEAEYVIADYRNDSV